MKRLSIVSALAALGLASVAQARKLPEIDVNANAATARSAVNVKSARSLIRAGSEAQIHERFNVPTFLWASKSASEAGLSAARAQLAKNAGVSLSAVGSQVHLSAEAAARAHLGVFASAYNLAPSDLSDASVAHVHDIGRGGIVVQFQQQVAGIEVFREQARVIMNRDLSLVAISGFISPTATAAANFSLGPVDAASIAFSDLSGTTLASGAMQGLGALEGGYEAVDLTLSGKSIEGATTQPARVKPVYFHTPDAMIPAWYVEVDSAAQGGSDMYSYVVSAQDGSLLFRHNLTAYDAAPPDAYTYRVWSFTPQDLNNPSAPFDGPHGNNMDPHPTGTLSGVQPVYGPQNDVTLVSSPYVTDPWLPIGATVSTGNNVDAYVDLVTPNGFAANTADFRAAITGPNAFQYTYDPTLPNAKNQQNAAIIQMFYNNNFFHDWYYASGFTEAAGNAQTNNYGRGGVAGDQILAEGQDFSGRNNANMSTPADGGHPRMQMFLFDGIGDRHFFSVSGTPGLPPDFATGVPSGFGIIGHDVTAEVVWLQDGIGSATYPPANTTVTTIHDGCDYTPGPGGAIDANWAGVTGKIAFIDRGGTSANVAIACGFQVKAFNATQAGAAGVIIASTTPHAAPAPIAMGAGTGAGNGTVTIPAYQLDTPDGDAIRALFGADGHGAAGPIMMRMVRAAVPDRDGTIDNQIMGHEWGHYISNRLISNASGLSTNMSGGMGEGWADTHAMLLTVKQEDSAVPSNLAYSGVYGLAIWTSVGGVNGPLANQGAYFGIRRVPYSTDLTKNPLTFQHIQDLATQPNVPVAFWPAPGTPSASGGNSEVHNTGEVWATMLWECYASLLADTVGVNPRLSFTEARNRWKDYLVAAYKMTPPQPTFLDARDAVLAAAYAGGDLTDYDHFLKAFAKRGAGFGAISPDRYSLTNNGVVESFIVAPNVSLVSASITDDGTSCDKDGVLDSGESGHLTITLRNDSGQFLSATTATVTATGPNAANLSFPGGATVSFPATAPGETTTASVGVALASGLTGLQPMDFQIAWSDSELSDLGTQTANFSQRGNFDDIANQSFTDDAESATTVFTQAALLAPAGAGNVPFGWSRNTITAYDHNYKAAAVGVQSDVALVSPAFTVGVAPFSLTFQHRYNWQISTQTSTGGVLSTALADGGVIEVSTDGGTTWVDITSLPGAAFASGPFPNQAYTGTLNGATTLGRRPAFARQSPQYPAYVTTTVNVPAALAGLTAQIRFRMATDASARGDGWEIDNIAVNGATARPFRSLLANKCNPAGAGQTNRRPTAAIAAQAAVPEGTTVNLTCTGTDADNDPLTFIWGQQTGPLVTFTTPDSSQPGKITFTAPEVTATTSVTMTCTVSDGTAFSTVATRAFNVTNVDKPPVANAGPDQTVNEGTLVILTAAGSSDPDGDALSFAWTQTAGPAVTLTGSNTVSPVFIAPNVPVTGATLTFSVAVTAAGVTRSASVNVNVTDVTNQQPTVSAGPNQSVNERTLGQLHAVANDPDGDPLTVTWTQVSPATPVIALSNAGDLSPTFTAPEVTADTDFTFQVMVSDGALSATATTVVTVKNVNQAPVAVASASPLATQEHGTITLDGTASFDPDGQGLTYSWTAVSPLPSGASIDNSTSAQATFNTGDVDANTQVTFALVVNDGFANSAPATVTVTVLDVAAAPVNHAPIAVATGPATAASSTTVHLSGTNSSDPDGDDLTFIWTQTNGPGVSLIGADTDSPSFVAPIPAGSTAALTFQLVVTDGNTLSAPSTITVTVHRNLIQPQAFAGPDLTALSNAKVQLSAAGSTSTNGDLTFQWTQLAPDPTGTAAVAFSDATSMTPTFIAPTVPTDVTFMFQVTVTDAASLTGTAQVSVKVKHLNNAPTVSGGTFVEVASGAAVTLDAGTATDLDNDQLTYAWSQIGGNSVTLTGANTAHPTFTAPAVAANTVIGFQVTITDGNGGSVTSRTSVTIDAPAAAAVTPPVAQASSSGGCSTGGSSSFAGIFALAGMMLFRRRRARTA
jgi:hypothetical protein